MKKPADFLITYLLHISLMSIGVKHFFKFFYFQSLFYSFSNSENFCRKTSKLCFRISQSSFHSLKAFQPCSVMLYIFLAAPPTGRHHSILNKPSFSIVLKQRYIVDISRTKPGNSLNNKSCISRGLYFCSAKITKTKAVKCLNFDLSLIFIFLSFCLTEDFSDRKSVV